MRVLFVCSNPTWTRRLDLGDEMREIMTSLKGQNVKLMLLPAAQRLDLKTAIASNDIDILHFSGHATEKEGIILRDEVGDEAPVSGEELQEWLAKTDSPIKLIVLNACSTKATAAKILDSVDSVIFTKKALNDNAAKKMTRVLYSQLCDGKSVEDACTTAREFIQETSPELDVYDLDGARKADGLFDKPSEEDAAKATISIEGKSTYDKYFFISYLDEQIRDITKRKKFNQLAFWVSMAFATAFFAILMFKHELAAQVIEFIKVSFLGDKRVDDFVNLYLHKPYLDSMIAVGAAIPALLSFFHTRLAIHGDERLNSLQQMKELVKASDELPAELQDKLQKILDQCIRGADKEPPNWFGFLKAFQTQSETIPQDAGA